MTNIDSNPFSDSDKKSQNQSKYGYKSDIVEPDYDPDSVTAGNSLLHTPLVADLRLNYADPDYSEYSNRAQSPNGYVTAGLKPEPEPYIPNKPGGKLNGNAYESEFERRERELRERERNLEAQARVLEEQRLEQQQESERLRNMSSNAPAGYRPANNFPPFYPLIYHNIMDEIPVSERKSVQILYKEWLSLVCVLLINCVACLVLLISAKTDVGSAGGDFGGSIVYFFVISVLSFFLWYRPVYNAYMKDSALFFGSAGLINFIRAISGGRVLTSVFCGIATACWFLHAFFALSLFRKTYSQYKNRGHSFNEARNQAYVGFARSSAGQAAVSSMVSSQV
ncbi:hypothetical protein BB560_001423 [Smittium megazygosporum]|uniref:Secretory carrier-associated membrane protein n=1 Tax=Smittium megazygosporum TaxID=133381 RepID=A0A2T9ZHM7_9FUNG|nr:hypothetical protein BB560_001423 [Smittium megazygosporum]